MAGNLKPFFAPASVAVVGAAERPTSSGGAVLQNLRISGFAGEIVPVNPKGGTMFGIAARKSLAELNRPAELAVIVIRPDLILDVAREAAATGHRNLLILPGGFAEAGEAGRARDKELRALIAREKLTVVGPNCAGIIHLPPGARFAATFLRDMPLGPNRHGMAAFITQSGALGEEAIAASKALTVPLGSLVSVGNAVQLGVADYLDYLGEQDSISVVLLYIESVDDEARFGRVARRVVAKKPVIALVGGRTDAGAAAAQRHTGAPAQGEARIEALCRDACLLRVKSLRQLLLAAKGFGSFPQGIGRRALILSNSGGPGVLCADEAAAQGLDLADLPQDMAATLRANLPPEAAVANPIDLLADAREDRFGFTLETAVKQGAGAFDAILGIHVVPFMVDAAPVIARMATLAPTVPVPMLYSMMGTLPGKADWFAAMEAAGVPVFNDVEAMAECAGLLVRYPALKVRAAAGV
ncbi:MAG: CoA-binding protein [Alphaproteobacteria bacterium]|nr:CoA-binding protein [Alphaproteobacteria bacterium]MDE1967276.1 CoA-binding protein [Alphaproteobacteria bacterium]MDE2514080.1 CoA-binding protein [Alphaproteobacteria bacterium]